MPSSSTILMGKNGLIKSFNKDWTCLYICAVHHQSIHSQSREYFDGVAEQFATKVGSNATQ